MEFTRTVTLAILILSFTVRRLEAQRPAPIGVGASLARETRSPVVGAPIPGPSKQDTSASSRSIVTRDALIGAGVGAVTGLLTAVIVTQTGNYSNHSDDGLAYLWLPIYGAMVGVVAGVIVGLIQIL
jgi:hypothetical protein